MNLKLRGTQFPWRRVTISYASVFILSPPVFFSCYFCTEVGYTCKIVSLSSTNYNKVIHKMLTKLEYDVMISLFKSGCKFWMIPLDWDEKTGGIRPANSKWKHPFFLFITFVDILYLSISIFQLPASLSTYNISGRVDDILFHGLIILWHTAILTLQISTLLYGSDISTMVAQLKQFNRKYGKTRKLLNA